MLRYKFPATITKWTQEDNIKVIKTITVIKYKCLICGYEHDWDDTWTDEKKAEVKAEVDSHHNEHIVDETTYSSGI